MGGSAQFLKLETLDSIKTNRAAIGAQLRSSLMPKSPRTISTSDKAKLVDYIEHSSEVR